MHHSRGASSSRSFASGVTSPAHRDDSWNILCEVMDHQCVETPVRDPAESRGITASLWPAFEAAAHDTCQDEARSNRCLVVNHMRSTPREWCYGFGPWLISTLRRRFGQLLHDFAVSQCVCSCGADNRSSVSDPALRLRLYVVINKGPVHRKGLTCGPEASDGSYRSTAADQYSIATGMLVVLTILTFPTSVLPAHFVAHELVLRRAVGKVSGSSRPSSVSPRMFPERTKIKESMSFWG